MTDPCHLPDDITFEAWINYVFDHPVLEGRWWWAEPESGYYQWWDERARPALTLSHLTGLFGEPTSLLRRFTRAQIDQGLDFPVNSACSGHLLVLSNIGLPWSDRCACIDAMIPLYAKLMAPVYGYDLGHIEKPDNPNRPNFACYMWWDIIPLYGGMDHPDRDRINDAVLNVFEQVLKLKSEACLESVLHGLGHWHLYIPDRTEPIVRQFLTRYDISDALREYAELAAIGGVP